MWSESFPNLEASSSPSGLVFKKSLLVSSAEVNREAMEYRLPATLVEFENPIQKQIELSGLATPREEVKWLIS